MAVPRFRRISAVASVAVLALGLLVFRSASVAVGEGGDPLGSPDHVGFAVPDINAPRDQLRAGTGTEFGTTTTAAADVMVNGEVVHVTLRTTVSTAGGPLIVLEQATPAVGPWAVGPGGSATFLSYAVDDVTAAGATLQAAGFQPAARTVEPQDGFAFWRGAGGVLVRLIDSDVAPEATSTANGGLGALRSVTFAPCPGDRDTVRSQLQSGLGLDWKTPLPLPLTWIYPDGSLRASLMRVDASQERAPHVTVETPEPVQQCAPGVAPSHVVFFTADVPGAEQRLTSAGMTVAARVPLVITYVRAAGGINIEVASSAFRLAELLP